MGLRPSTFLVDLGPLALNGWNIPFDNHVKYLGVIFDERITWRLHVEMIEAKAFRTFIKIYSLFRSELLSAIVKLTLHKALIRSVMTYACPAWELVAETSILKIAVHAKQGSAHKTCIYIYIYIHVNTHTLYSL
jgi:hypothetical protein